MAASFNLNHYGFGKLINNNIYKVFGYTNYDFRLEFYVVK